MLWWTLFSLLCFWPHISSPLHHPPCLASLILSPVIVAIKDFSDISFQGIAWCESEKQKATYALIQGSFLDPVDASPLVTESIIQKRFRGIKAIGVWVIREGYKISTRLLRNEGTKSDTILRNEHWMEEHGMKKKRHTHWSSTAL